MYFHSSSSASQAQLEDDWSILHQARPFLIREIDASKILPIMRSEDVIDDQEMALVQGVKEKQQRTEALLDILEMKPQAVYDIFLNALGDVYPHVYLAMTGDYDPLDDDDDY